MSWRSKEDLGACLVAKIHDQLRMQTQWLIDCGRGFTYWPSEFATTVSSDPPNFHNAYSIFRLHAETEVAKGGAERGKVELPIARRMCRSALSALTYDESTDRYRLHCSAYAHCDNAEWLARVLIGAVGLQIAGAPGLAQWMSDELGLEPARSRHPTSGSRTSPDPVLGAVDRFVIPAGASPSAWLDSPEWEEAHSVVRRMSRRTEFDGRSSIRAEFDWLHDAPIVLRVTACEPHARLGAGLLCSLSLPWTQEPEARGQTAAELNRIERIEWNWCHDLGSWCLEGDELAFVCFVPNVCHAPGCLSDLVRDMALRARWVNETAGLAVLGVSR